MSKNSPIVIKESQLKGYKRVFVLNGFTLNDQPKSLFRYVPYQRFVNSVQNQELAFVSPELWEDPLERCFYGMDCNSHNYNTEGIACMSVSEKSVTNEAACWKVFKNHDRVLRISFNKLQLLSLIDAWAEANDAYVYLGKALYEYDQNEILKASESTSPLYKTFCPFPMERMHYLSLMLLKRKAFSFENELRIFIVGNSLILKDGLLIIPCDYTSGLVTKITLEPYPPKPEVPDYDIAKYRAKNMIDSKEYKRILSSIVKCDVEQSRLYENFKHVERLV